MKKFSCLAAVVLLIFASLQVSAFIIEDIEVKGLKRVSPGRVFSILPLRVYQDFNVDHSEDIIQTLYATGLFDDVTLRRHNNELVIEVIERPGIKGINIVGNETIDDEQLLAGLGKANIAVGLVFDRLALERLRNELKEQYYAIGKYAARVNTNIDELGDNQVNISVDINEGEIATIKKIRIMGNTKISDKELLKQFQSGTTRWYEFWSSKNHYARSKLMADLETMNNFYRDIGYLNFEVAEINVSLSPDKKDISIDITVREGGRYRVGDIAIAGEFKLDREKIQDLISLKKGEIFSRSKAVRSSEAIRHLLRNNGYAFSEVNLMPQIREEEGAVDVAFIIIPKQETYVRRINITGNEDTNDEVFRREMRQLEGAKFSASKIEKSRRRLQRLPYVQSAEISDHPIEGVNNQVDLDVKVAERFSGNFNIGAGYSDSSGAVLSFSLNQENFLGSGNRISFTFRNNDSDTSYAIGFLDPYYKLSGISRSWHASYRSVDYEQREITNLLSSKSDELRLRLNYGIPISENDVFGIGGQIEDISITLSEGSNQTNDVNRREIINCIEKNDGEFTNFRLNGNINYDTRDRATFTTEGTRISVSTELYTPLGDSNYFKTDYSHRHYFPLDEEKDFVLSAHGNISYARAYNSSCIPFFDKYYAGGARTIRGYANNSLGPLDDDGDSVGGNFRVIGNFDLYFPTDFLYDKRRFRTSIFADLGNAFRNAEEFETSELRGAFGLQVQWLTGIGGITFNFASHLNDQSEDDTESFQFELGTNF